jgi:putative flippase GtrA
MIPMLSYLKAQTVFIIASLTDYALTLFSVEVWHSSYLAGNLAGNILGAIAQFILCRSWVFQPKEKRIPAQVFKFVLVYAGDLILSALGVYFFTHFLDMHYVISKLITSVTLGLTYNYLLQKQFVFRAS